GHREPEGDLALGTLLRPGTGHRETLGTVDDVHAVALGAEFDELVARHRVELFLGRIGRGVHRLLRQFGPLVRPAHVVSLLFTHDRDPIHIAAPTVSTMPTTQMAMNSVAGPNPPRP